MAKTNIRTVSSPTVFVSYSWDSEEHRAWVAGFTDYLRRAGADVLFDGDLKLGQRLPKFMEQSITKADYVVVMYSGRIVEAGTAKEVFANPSHPYTIGLMESKPVVGRHVDELYSIPGKVPNPVNMPDYCYFRDRCDRRIAGTCDGAYPDEINLSETHRVSCYRYT